jgi:hypothetical protein
VDGSRAAHAAWIHGNSFEGDNTGTSGSANTPAFAEKYIKRYPLQTSVQVFYDPKDPTQSTLVLPGRMISLALWLIAAVLAGAAYAAGWLFQ